MNDGSRGNALGELLVELGADRRDSAPSFPWAIAHAPNGLDTGLVSAWERAENPYDRIGAAWLTGQCDPICLFLTAQITGLVYGCGRINEERQRTLALLEEAGLIRAGHFTVPSYAGTTIVYYDDLLDEPSVQNASNWAYYAARMYVDGLWRRANDLAGSHHDIVASGVGIGKGSTGLGTHYVEHCHRSLHELVRTLRAPTLAEWRKVGVR